MTSDVERGLAEATSLQLVWDAGRQAGTCRSPDLHFVRRGELVLLLVDSDGARSPAWQRDLRSGRRVQLDIDAAHHHGVVESLDLHDLDEDDVLALFRDKYGMQLVKVWYEGSAYQPIAIRLLQPSLPPSDQDRQAL